MRHLVELHGGTITAESEGEGKGATFTINLPVRAVSTRARAESFAAGERPRAKPRNDETPNSGSYTFPPMLTGLRILIVDDEEEARDLIATILRKYGATVTVATSSADAFSKLTNAKSHERFDLLVSDIGMPDEDGYSLIRRIRRKDAQQGGQTPAVALTVYGRATDRIRALESGFQMHVPKPVEPAELMMVIASLTGRSSKERCWESGSPGSSVYVNCSL